MNRRRTHHGDRGMTLLEVLLAVLMLCLASAVVMGAISSLTSIEARGRRRLAAYEVANRLMLQRLDDEKAMPPQSVPIAYGNYRFFWDLEEVPATMVINRRQESSGPNLQALDRFKLVGVTVFDSDHNGDFETRGEPIAFISRIIDPFAPRNPDSLENFSSPDRIMDWLRPLLGGGGGGPATSGNSSLDGRRLK